MPSSPEVKLSPTGLTAVARLFSSSVFMDLGNKGGSELLARLALRDDLPRPKTGSTIGEYLDLAFDALSASNEKNEYVYRAALVEQVRHGVHAEAKSAVVSEFRTASCRADLVVFNGTATAYEIKSDRDNLDRLVAQVRAYTQVFPVVYVICSAFHLDSVREELPESIGLLTLGDDLKVCTERGARECYDQISPTEVFRSIRRGEAKTILKLMRIDVPEVPNTAEHSALLEIFRSLRAEEIYKHLPQVLRDSRSMVAIESLMQGLPRSVQPGVALMRERLSRTALNRLATTLQEPASSIKNWV